MNIKDNYLFRLDSYLKERLVLPAQTAIDRKIFKRVFQLYAGKPLRVFEWGSGVSTVYYSRYLLSLGCNWEWHSIDNSQEWKDKVSRLVGRYGLQDKIHLYLSEFPAFWQFAGWSWQDRKVPPEVCNPAVVEYVEYPRRLVAGKGFDVVIVDGRFRRRCLRTAAEILAPDGLVLLHDAQRSHYPSSLELYRFGCFFNSGSLLGSQVKLKTWIGALDSERKASIISICEALHQKPANTK